MRVDVPAPTVGAGSGANRVGPTASLPLAAVVVAACVGFALRVALLGSAISRPDADEVIAPLMARHIGTDGYPWFFWGQHYGGTPQLLPLALSRRLLGDSLLAARVPTFLLAAGVSLVLWRVATRVVSPRAAQVAAIFSWVGAPSYLWLSVREMLFYAPTMFLGLLASLFAFRWRERGRRRDRNGFIAALVIGAWASPFIVFFALPALVVAGELWRRRWIEPLIGRWRAHRRIIVPIAGGALGVLVALGLEAWEGPGVVTVSSGRLVAGFPERLVFSVVDGLPALLGFREMLTYRWIFGAVGAAMFAAVLVVIVLGGRTALRAGAWDGVGLVAFPFLLALLPKATDQPNVRYLSFAVPFVCVAVARVVTGRRWLPAVSVLVAVALVAVSFHRLHVVSEVERTVRVGNVGDLDAAIAVLDRHGIDVVYADYWAAFRISFESSERIIGATAWDEPRYPPYVDTARDRRARVWVVGAGPQAEDLRRAYRRLGVPWEEHPAGEFVVVIPERFVPLPELGAALATR